MNTMADKQLIKHLARFLETASSDEILIMRSKSIDAIAAFDETNQFDYKYDALLSLKMIDEELNARGELERLRSTYNTDNS